MNFKDMFESKKESLPNGNYMLTTTFSMNVKSEIDPAIYANPEFNFEAYTEREQREYIIHSLQSLLGLDKEFLRELYHNIHLLTESDNADIINYQVRDNLVGLIKNIENREKELINGK